MTGCAAAAAAVEQQPVRADDLARAVAPGRAVHVHGLRRVGHRRREEPAQRREPRRQFVEAPHGFVRHREALGGGPHGGRQDAGQPERPVDEAPEGRRVRGVFPEVALRGGLVEQVVEAHHHEPQAVGGRPGQRKPGGRGALAEKHNKLVIGEFARSIDGPVFLWGGCKGAMVLA